MKGKEIKELKQSCQCILVWERHCSELGLRISFRRKKIILSGGDWKGAEREPHCGIKVHGRMAQLSTTKDSLNFLGFSQLSKTNGKSFGSVRH